MDQDAFRRTYRDVNERSCAYEKSVLTNQCDCAQAERFCIAEREGVRCRSEEGQARCLELLAVLREQARFALRTDQDKSALPHGKAIRIQVGGLRGLHVLLHPEQDPPTTIADVDALTRAVAEKFGRFDALPFSRIMQHIAAYQGRRRVRRRDR